MPFPSSADAVYLCSYLPVLAAVVFGFGGRTVRSLRALLDGSVLAAAIGYVGAVTLILPQIGQYQWLPTAISVAYPLADIVILSVLLSMVFGGHRSVPRSYVIVASAYAVSALTDAGYTYLEGINGYSTGSWLDIGWQVQAVLLCIAAATALRGEQEPEARILSRDTGLVPVLVGVAVMLVRRGRQSLGQTLDVGAVALMAYAVVAVVLRLYLVSRENWRIARELELSLAEQERLAVTDGLTGLRNRRFLEAALSHEFGRARRSERGAGLLVIDIDHFKRINDKHGHLAGDAVLQEVAQRLAGMMRSGDVVARYGGEEFVALLPEIESEALLELGERCRKAIANHSIDFGDNQLSVTVSIGGGGLPLRREHRRGASHRRR